MMLTAERLTLRVPGRTLIDRAALTVREGECWAVLGPNGAGKSILLHTLAGLRVPAEGVVRIDGIALAQWPRRRLARQLALLLQDEPAVFWGTVEEYVRLGRLPHHGPLERLGQDDERSVAGALDELALTGFGTRRYRSLSGGERQRVRLAQLLAQSPRLLLLDEPLNHLDLGQQDSAMALVRRLARSGRAVLCTIHDPAWALAYCSHALLMYDSGDLLQGPAAEVLTPASVDALYGRRVSWPLARGASGVSVRDRNSS